MNRFRWHVLLGLLALLAAAPSAQAQRPRFRQGNPHIGYVYPAGGQQGTTLEVTVGGQYLSGASDVHLTGDGVQATVVKYSRPLTPKEANELRNKLQEVRKRMEAERKNRSGPFRRGAYYQTFLKYAREAGLDVKDLEALRQLRKQRTDPKHQLNPQIAETVTLRVEIAPDAEPGERALRLRTPSGLSNPICFHVGQPPEYREQEPNDQTPDTGVLQPLPAILNGQILPGDVDRFRFPASKGERLVIAVSARKLIPYLADAVPGWFQATVALYDAAGNEVAYADDFRFDPDPVLYYEIPKDGQYVLEIKDAIYRGRQDFVYRITLGEVPFVTSIFPLGARRGARPTVALTGWNLPVDSLTLDAQAEGPRTEPLWLRAEPCDSNRVRFAVDTLPECLQEEPNDEPPAAQPVRLPLIVNGRIDHPGDWDVFRFEGRAGESVVAEVLARRLDSPLDSVLQLTDARGRTLAVNDDHEDKGAGLTTHYADSWLAAQLPASGTYYLRLADAQHQGGSEYAYRLRISPPRPDFALRVVPSTINARAGATMPITVYALRKDGFAGDIALRLNNAPPGFALSGAWVPAGQDHVRLTLSVPAVGAEEPYRLALEGRAVIQGQEIVRPAVPADDMTQAFIYHHLVPTRDWLVTVLEGRWRRPLVKLLSDTPVQLPEGGTAQVRFFRPGGLLMSQVQLALSDPPDGIAIQDVSYGRLGVAIELKADAAKVRPGLKGNLIVDAFVERKIGRAPGGQQASKRRIPIGTLPAIPFEVVGSSPSWRR